MLAFVLDKMSVAMASDVQLVALQLVALVDLLMNDGTACLSTNAFEHNAK